MTISKFNDSTPSVRVKIISGLKFLSGIFVGLLATLIIAFIILFSTGELRYDV